MTILGLIGKEKNFFTYPQEIIDVEEDIRKSKGTLIKSKEGIESVLKRADHWYENEIESIKSNEKGLHFALKYSKIGKVCKNICDLIEQKEKNNKDINNRLEWLIKRSNVELTAGESLDTEKEYTSLNHRYKCYGFSGDCDRDIGIIYKNRGEIINALNYFEKSIKKYTQSINVAKELIETIKDKDEIKKINNYIGHTYNYISRISILMFNMTHDEDYIENAKSYFTLSENNFKDNIMPKEIILTQMKIYHANQDIKENFKIDEEYDIE